MESWELAQKSSKCSRDPNADPSPEPKLIPAVTLSASALGETRAFLSPFNYLGL